MHQPGIIITAVKDTPKHERAQKQIRQRKLCDQPAMYTALRPDIFAQENKAGLCLIDSIAIAALKMVTAHAQRTNPEKQPPHIKKPPFKDIFKHMITTAQATSISEAPQWCSKDFPEEHRTNIITLCQQSIDNIKDGTVMPSLASKFWGPKDPHMHYCALAAIATLQVASPHTAKFYKDNSKDIYFTLTETDEDAKTRTTDYCCLDAHAEKAPHMKRMANAPDNIKRTLFDNLTISVHYAAHKDEGARHYAPTCYAMAPNDYALATVYSFANVPVNGRCRLNTILNKANTPIARALEATTALEYSDHDETLKNTALCCCADQFRREYNAVAQSNNAHIVEANEHPHNYINVATTTPGTSEMHPPCDHFPDPKNKKRERNFSTLKHLSDLGKTGIDKKRGFTHPHTKNAHLFFVQPAARSECCCCNTPLQCKNAELTPQWINFLIHSNDKGAAKGEPMPMATVLGRYTAGQHGGKNLRENHTTWAAPAKPFKMPMTKLNTFDIINNPQQVAQNYIKQFMPQQFPQAWYARNHKYAPRTGNKTKCVFMLTAHVSGHVNGKDTLHFHIPLDEAAHDAYAKIAQVQQARGRAVWNEDYSHTAQTILEKIKTHNFKHKDDAIIHTAHLVFTGIQAFFVTTDCLYDTTMRAAIINSFRPFDNDTITEHTKKTFNTFMKNTTMSMQAHCAINDEQAVNDSIRLQNKPHRKSTLTHMAKILASDLNSQEQKEWAYQHIPNPSPC